MAERTSGWHDVIPLSQWLSGRDTGDGTQAASARILMAESSHDADPVTVADEAYARGRQDALSELEASLEALHDKHRLALAEQEAALNARWASHLSADLTSSVTAAFLDLRHQIESAICGVLQPFVAEVLPARASQKLLNLLQEETARASGPVLEIRCPIGLHEELRRMLSANGIAATLSESDSIEVIAGGGTSRFESMAMRWAATLRGGEA